MSQSSEGEDEDILLTVTQNIEIGTKLDVQFEVKTPDGTVLQWFCGTVIQFDENQFKI